MLETLGEKQEEELKYLWSYGYPKYQDSFLRHYMQYVFPKGTCLGVMEEGLLKSTLSLYSETLYLDGRTFPVYLFKDIVTHPDCRRKGYMKELMQDALAQSDANSLFTLVNAFNPKLFERFGFRTVYYHKHYILMPSDLKNVKAHRISFYASAEELFVLFREFIKKFDGYFERKIPYFDELLRLVDEGVLYLCVYRNMEEQIEGYAFYKKEQGEVIVQEIVYLNSNGLKSLLKAIIGEHQKLHVWVSQRERLERVFPLVVPKKSNYMMVRCNHLELYNKLCGTQYKDVVELYGSIKKPLFLNTYE